MKAVVLTLALALGAALPSGLTAQDAAARLEGRVAPDVERAVLGVAADAAAQGLPVEPLVQKAIEGGAKGVPPDRIIVAVRAVAHRLAEAARALRAAELRSASGTVVEEGADAINAGLSAAQVTELARASRPPYDPALTLRVAATLAALGVPPDQVLDLVAGAMRAGRGPTDLLALPDQVQAGIARGATPAQAAAGLARAAGGSPPGRPASGVPPGQANPHRPPNPHKP